MATFLAFELTPTAEFFRTLSRESVAADPGAQRAIRAMRRVQGIMTWVIAAGALTAVAGIVVMGMERAGGVDRGGPILVVGLVVGIAGGLKWREMRKRVAELTNGAAPDPEDAPPERIRHELSEMGVLYEDSHMRTEYRWSMFVTVSELPSFIVLDGVDGLCIVVPRPVLGSAQACATFVERVRALIAAASSDARSRLRAYFAGTNAPCPGCRYSLHGSDGDKCPECGRAVMLADFPAAGTRPAQSP